MSLPRGAAVHGAPPAPVVGNGAADAAAGQPLTWKGLSLATRVTIVFIAFLAVVGVVVGILSGTNQLQNTGRFFTKDLPNFFTTNLPAKIWWTLVAAVFCFLVALGIRKCTQRIDKKNHAGEIGDLRTQLANMAAAGNNPVVQGAPVDNKVLSGEIQEQTKRWMEIDRAEAAFEAEMALLLEELEGLEKKQLAAKEKVQTLQQELDVLTSELAAKEELETTQQHLWEEAGVNAQKFKTAKDYGETEVDGKTYTKQQIVDEWTNYERKQENLLKEQVNTRTEKFKLQESVTEKEKELRLAESHKRFLTLAIERNFASRTRKQENHTKLQNDRQQLKLVRDALTTVKGVMTKEEHLQGIATLYNADLERLKKLGWESDAKNGLLANEHAYKMLEQDKAVAERRITDAKAELEQAEKDLTGIQNNQGLKAQPQFHNIAISQAQQKVEQKKKVVDDREAEYLTVDREWRQAGDRLLEHEKLMAEKKHWERLIETVRVDKPQEAADPDDTTGEQKQDDDDDDDDL